MKIIDPGHQFKLTSLDGDHSQVLQFVKRHDPGNPGGGKYPGNFESYPGTTIQEVIRALTARIQYVQKQSFCLENVILLGLLRLGIWLLEFRAKRRRGEILGVGLSGIEHEPTCPACGHVQCSGCID